MGFHVYDLSKITANFAGIPLNQGAAEGDFIKVIHQAYFKMKKGALGDVSRSKTYDKTARVELHLMQTSPLNATLSTLHLIDRKADNGAGVGTFFLKDQQGLSTHTAAKAWIEGPPETGYGAESGDRVWMIDVADMESFIGGN